ICFPWYSELVCELSDRVVSIGLRLGIELPVVLIRRDGRVAVVLRVVCEVPRWWDVCVCVLLSLSFTSGLFLLLDLPSYLILSADALVVDLLGLLWGQPELGGCRLRVYVRWGCGSRACGGGGAHSSCLVLPLLSPLRLLRLLSLLFYRVFSLHSPSASPSLFLSAPPFGLLLCEPFSLLAYGFLADRREVLRGDS